MAVPVLRELLVERYGVRPQGAQVFMAINLVGAAAAVPLLVWARPRFSAVGLLVAASLADTALLLLLAAPVGFTASLVLRALEGVTDVMVFAMLFDIVRRASGTHAARGMGMASTPLLLGLGAGAVLGGVAAGRMDGDAHQVAYAVFGASAAFSGLVALLAAVAWGPLTRLGPEAPAVEPASPAAAGALGDRPRPLGWSCAMAFADRATGGLITGTLPLVLAQVLGYTRQERGWLLGLPLLLMAVGTGPAGALCDRWGSLRLRLVAGLLYAGAFAAIPLAGAAQGWLAVVMVAVGLSGSVMFASSLAMAAQAGRGAVGLGAFRASGDLGFFAGTTLSIVMLSAGSDAEPTFAQYARVIVAFALGHAAITATLAALAWRQRLAGRAAARALS